jgi:hypothetical protein
MSTLAMVEENCATADRAEELTNEELKQITLSLDENKKLADLYCTGCNYCMPCPHEVNIPLNFSLMNHHRVYGLTDHAKTEYGKIGTVEWLKGNPASDCVECGECEPKCPQHIPIIAQLKETHRALSS